MLNSIKIENKEYGVKKLSTDQYHLICKSW